MLILAVRVDDMAVAGLKIEVDKLLVTLNEDFTTVDLGILSFFTGCTVIQDVENGVTKIDQKTFICLLYTSPSPRDGLLSRMPSSA